MQKMIVAVVFSLCIFGFTTYRTYFQPSVPIISVSPNPSIILSVIPTISYTASASAIPTTRVLGVATSKCHATQLESTDDQSFIPDPTCTPGSLNPLVTQETISKTICVSGYTATIRPSTYYTNKLKKQQIIEYGYLDTELKNYEEDHFISLELGGSPDDPKNLWPEPHPSYNEKDRVENYLHKQICSGAMTLAEAQKAITINWYEVYKKINK